MPPAPPPLRHSIAAVSAAVAVAAVVVALTVAQAFLYLQDSDVVGRIVDDTLARSEAITRSRKAAIDEAVKPGPVRCSAQDVDALKRITYQSTFISDLGRVSNGTLVCSGVWGTLALVLPPPSFARGPTRIWLGDALAGTPYAGTTLMAHGDTFSVSSPSAFVGLDPAGTSTISLTVSDGSKNFVVRHIGPTATGASASRFTVAHSRCSAFNGVCASAESPRRSIWSLQPWTLALILLIGALAGGVLATIYRYVHGAHRQPIQSRLIQAIEAHRIHLVYQPLRRLQGHTLQGFEALSRWRTENGDEISPSVFIPIARQFGISQRLFRYVVARVLQEFGAALRQHPHLYISVNAEPEDMAQDCLVRYLTSIVADAGVRTDQIRIEVTEREDLSSPLAKANMAELAGLGFKFLIDDFGTGSANFSHLAQSPFSCIKIDGMFVSAITGDSPLKPVLPGMYQIAHALGLAVIIEGIETAEQLELLHQLAPGAIGQGWHLGRPMPLADAQQLLHAACTRCG